MPEADTAGADLAVAGRVLLELDPRELIENPHNPRTELRDLTELTDSIRTVGCARPLIVTQADDGQYLLLFGHRRRAAAIEAGLAMVPCDVREELHSSRSAPVSCLVRRQGLEPRTRGLRVRCSAN